MNRICLAVFLLCLSLSIHGCRKNQVEDDAPRFAELTKLVLSDGLNVYEPVAEHEQDVYFCIPSGHDLSHIKASFSHNGEHLYIDGREIRTEECGIDFSKSTAPALFNVVSKVGYDHHYNVYLFDLPIVFIDTPDSVPIKDKSTWVPGSTIKIIDTDGSVNLEATTSVKGRGNTTWGYPKKPYTIKLESKSKVLGMPSDKRWNFLANWADRTLMRNTIALAISDKTKSLEWTPRGKHVELILNGQHLGNYFLCEHIKISKNRINIKEMDTVNDISGDALTGGYVLEIDSHYDEPFKFRSSYRNLPVMLKYPDENVRTLQFDYIKKYINDLEGMLHDRDRLLSREYADYLDIDTFIDYFLVHELAEYSGPADDAYSSHVYKDRLGKLKAGPVWDFDRTTFKPGVTQFLNRNNALWYDYLFSDPVFVTRLKEKWAESRKDFESVIPFIEEISDQIRRSAVFTIKTWPTTSTDNGDESMSFDKAAERLKKAYSDRIICLDALISAL